MALTQYGQAELRGLLMGLDTVYRLSGFNPFDHTARADNQQNLSQASGAYSGKEYTDVKQVPLRVIIDLTRVGLDDDDEEARFDAHQDLLVAFAPSDVDLPLRFMWGGRTLRINGRPRVATADPELLTAGRVKVEAGFVALDPTIYSDDEAMVSLSLPVDSGGLTLPFTLATAINATLSSTQRIVTNEGKAQTTWTAVLTGPAVNPRLINFTTGDEFRLGLTLGVGEFVTLDSSTRSVLLGGTVSRRGVLSGHWWQLDPGDNLITWFSDTFDVNASFEITYRHAWR